MNQQNPNNSRFVLDSILGVFIARMADDLDGFNFQLQGCCEKQGVHPYEIEFDEESSTNFFASQFVAAKLFENDNCTLPMVQLYESSLVQTNIVFANQFAGEVTMHVDVTISWSSAKFADYRKLRVATVDAMYRTFNGSDPGDGPYQLGNGAVQYGGNLSYGPPSKIVNLKGDIDVQVLPFTLSCTSIAN